MKSRYSRRSFLGHAAAAVAAPTIIPASVFGQNAPSKRVSMGFIGMGNRGIGVMEAFLNHADVQGVAVCDMFHGADQCVGKGGEGQQDEQDCGERPLRPARVPRQFSRMRSSTSASNFRR